MQIRRITRSFGIVALKNEIGASLVEYALLLALIASVAIGAITLVGRETKREFNCIAIELEHPGLRQVVVEKVDDDGNDSLSAKQSRFAEACL